MNGPSTSLSILDRARIRWVVARYNFWLDLYFVPLRRRRPFRRELRSNLNDAALTGGVKLAIAGLGSIRSLAAEVATEPGVKSRWYMGAVVAAAVLAGAFIGFMLLSLYYVEGVLDSGVSGEVSSSLFPFLWSHISVDVGDGGFMMTGHPGPLPPIAALGTWLWITKPWLAIRNRLPSSDLLGGGA